MKKLILFLFILALTVTASFAQAPQKFSYQAVVRDASNNLIANQSVGVQISILQGSAAGEAVYVETQNATTNANGLMTLEIGGGTMLSGDFATIDWGDGPYFLKTETDPNGGTNYTIEGTQQLLSVPYALYAGSAANSFSGSYNDLTDLPQIPDIPEDLSAFNNDVGYITMDSVPTDISAFNNNVGFITMDSVPTDISAFNNNVGYITMDSVPAMVSAFENDAHYITDLQLQQILNTIAEMQNEIDSMNQVIEALNSQVSQLIPTLATVVTHSVESIATTSAVTGGNVTSNGHDEIIARGVCWSTNNPPTIADSHTTDGLGLGEYTSTVSGLVPNTTYYLCAYVTNVVGTSYGEVMTFTTPCNSVTISISGTTSIGAGQSTTLAASGANTYLWSTEETTASITTTPAETTTYTVIGTNQYGCTGTASVTVTVIPQGGQPCPGMATITDYDNNIYNTVQIGNQCWMKENLRTTSYSDGTPIEQGTDTSRTTAYWYYPSGNSDNMSTLGLLYNWAAVMRGSASSSENPSGVQGVCPTGWHVPSDAEWTELTDYVSSQSEYACNGTSIYIAKSLASTTGWNSFSSNCTVGNTPSDNNATGLGIVPAGYYSGNYNAATTAYCSSATEYNENYVYNRNIGFFSSTVNRGNLAKYTALSVRCIRD